MKKKALKFLAISMALNILFSSMGLAFYEHSCSMSSNKSISLHEKDACCKVKVIKEDGADHGHQVKQGKCCESHSVHKKLDSKNNYSSKKLSAKMGAKAIEITVFSFVESPSAVRNYPLLYSNPPPLSGRQHLLQFQQFRI